MSSKSSTIAAQAIGVATLGAIVYFAFLSPDDPGTLSEIEVNDGVTVQAPRPSVQHPRRQQPAAKPRRASKRKITPPVPVTPAPTTVSPPGDTPAGAQYADAVARILGAVTRGSSP